MSLSATQHCADISKAKEAHHQSGGDASSTVDVGELANQAPLFHSTFKAPLKKSQEEGLLLTVIKIFMKASPSYLILLDFHPHEGKFVLQKYGQRLSRLNLQ